jgi:hypothetical protein
LVKLERLAINRERRSWFYISNEPKTAGSFTTKPPSAQTFHRAYKFEKKLTSALCSVLVPGFADFGAIRAQPDSSAITTIEV